MCDLCSAERARAREKKFAFVNQYYTTKYTSQIVFKAQKAYTFSLHDILY